MRDSTLFSYESRIINLTNLQSDLTALPGLKEIYDKLSLKTINRLKTTNDRINLAREIVKTVFSFVKKSDEKAGSNNGDLSDEDLIGGNKIGVVMDCDSDANDMGNDQDISSEVMKQMLDIIKKQKDFIDNHANEDKTQITLKEKQMLVIIEKNGVSVTKVGSDLFSNNPTNIIGIDCVVVKNLNKDLIFSDVFPLCVSQYVDDSTKQAVNKGICFGNVLGKKLQIRQETQITKFNRRLNGKIDRRVLADIACDKKSIFYKMRYDSYRKLNLHISVDASGSMGDGQKWQNVISTVVAICKAASMISNLRVSVSFRCTIQKFINGSKNFSFPYIVLAYDSDKDKFSKIKNLFPYLSPTGATPEGLVFEATMDELVNKKTDEDYYFLTLSDGQPCFSYKESDGSNIVYDMVSGADHTKKQYNKILKSGVKGMSYLIEPDGSYKNPEINECFKKMYGKDFKRIDVNNVTSIAKSMNDLFLDKD
jgi:hypothetical protein